MRVAVVEHATAADRDLRVHHDTDLAVELAELRGRWVVIIAIARVDVPSKSWNSQSATDHVIETGGKGRAK